MPSDRIESLRKMLDRNPSDARVRFGLALEYEKAGRWEEMAAELERYLEQTDDEGNAWGRLATALRRLERDDEALDAYARGIEAALRHGHPNMAAEFEDEVAEMEGRGREE